MVSQQMAEAFAGLEERVSLLEMDDDFEAFEQVWTVCGRR